MTHIDQSEAHIAGLVYEAEIVSVDTRAARAEVRFLGFGNKETKVNKKIFLLVDCADELLKF